MNFFRKKPKSIFYTKPKPFRERLADFLQSILFWRGRKKGIAHTRNLKWSDLQEIFFPKDFYEKYCYLGAIPYNTSGEFFDAMKPLILVMDAEARPEWCPRCFLRFLHVFGNDKSIVRVRNRFWYKLHKMITKGITFWDYKTKWTHYDLRISISAPKYIQDLANTIEKAYYKKGFTAEMIEQLSNIKEVTDEHNLNHITYCELINLYRKHFPEY